MFGKPIVKVGEKRIDHDGYVQIKMPSHPDADRRGYVREHRWVIEQQIGRLLTKEEKVHHKNEIRHDNRPDNLQLCANTSEHNLIHRPRKKCSICSKPHFGKGFCMYHYNKLINTPRSRVSFKCEGCGCPCRKSSYKSKDSKILCKACRYPIQKCTKCGKPAKRLALCKKCRDERYKVPCAKCGKKISNSGRNHFPAVCWKCKFPKRLCLVCGVPHRSLGLCDNHLHQFKRTSLTINEWLKSKNLQSPSTV